MQNSTWYRGLSLHIHLIFWLLIGAHPAFAQSQEGAQYLDTVQIAGSRLHLLTPGHKRISIDSLTLQEAKGQNLADLLSRQSDVFIKSYGLGSLATTSLRGGGASHTAVIWNGFSLQSPMNGQLDLSLLPVFFFDEVEVQYGGSAALYGSGAVGGAIHLDNQIDFEKGLRIGGHGKLGSFGEKMSGLDVAMSTKSSQAQNQSLFPTGRETTSCFLTTSYAKQMLHISRQGSYKKSG